MPKDLGKRSRFWKPPTLFSWKVLRVSWNQMSRSRGLQTHRLAFGDKEALFFAAVQAKCDEMLPHDLFTQELRGPVRDQLQAIATAFFGLVSSDEAISTHRMMITPGGADDRLRNLFWEAGPQRAHDAFSSFLLSRVEAGELEIPDVRRATEQFFALIKGEMHSRMMCGLCAHPASAEVSSHIDASVDMFLRAYGQR